MNMRRCTLIPAAASILLAVTAVEAQETIHPGGVNLDCRYTLSGSQVVLGDTLTIERILTNNESYPATGVYFTDNLPSQFDVVDAAVTIDGAPVPFLADGPESSQVFPGYYVYRWTVDSPDSSEQLNRPLNPGEVLVVRYHVVGRDIGTFALPLHATVAYGNGSGIFAGNAADTVKVLSSVGVNDPDDSPLPTSFQVVSPYPNPFNSEVSIAYSGTGLARKVIRLEIFDALGRRVASRSVRAGSDAGILHWAPDLTTGSGVYFFRVEAGGATARGKMVLLK